MRVVRFNYNKLLAEKLGKLNKINIDTDIQFTNLEKEKNQISEEEELANVSFIYKINYKNAEKKDEKLGEIKIEGDIVILASKEESKEMWKTWKKKDFPMEMRIFFSNQIIKKCLPNVVKMQEQVNLPYHLPLPLLSATKPSN